MDFMWNMKNESRIRGHKEQADIQPCWVSWVE